MPVLVKPYTYSSGTTISSTQVNANEDAIINVVNALDEDNLDPSTQIPNSMLVTIEPDIVDAHADTAAEYLTATTPGATGGLLATTTAVPDKLSDEIERLRYRHLANNHLTNTYFTITGGASTAVGWVEPQIVGPQLFSNNGFETKTSGTASVAPDGWTLVGAPTSLTITAPGLAVPAAGLNKKALRVTYGAVADRGFSQVLSGLKASTKYLIGMSYARVSGSPVLKITTTNGLAAGDYKNLASTVTPSGTAIANFQGVVQTTTTGTSITVSFTNTSAAGDVVDFYQVWAFEMSDSTNIGLPHIPMQTATSSTLTDYAVGSSAWAWGTHTALSLSQYIPAPGYKITYEVVLSYTSEPFNIDAADSITAPNNDYSVFGFRLQLDSGSGASTVAGPYVSANRVASTNAATGGIVTLKYTVESPTPGSTYAFTVQVGAYGQAASWSSCRINPLLEAEQSVSTSRLIVERL